MGEAVGVAAADALHQARARLQGLLAGLEPIARSLAQPEGAQRDLQVAIDALELRVVVAGEVNRGKSTFLNALVGQRVFPPRASVCTAVLTCLRDGEPARATLCNRDGSTVELVLGDEPGKTLYGHVGRKNPDAQKLERVDVWFPNTYARHGVVIIDTPGVNDAVAWRERVTVQALATCDAVLFLLDAKKALTASDRTFLEANVLTEWGRRVIFVVNKADGLSEEDRDAVWERCERELGRIVPGPSIHFLSAKQALEGRKTADVELVQASGMPDLAELLRRLLVDHRLRLYVDDREARFRALATRYRAFIDGLRADLDARLVLSEDDHQSALAELDRRSRAYERRLDRFRSEGEAFSRDVRALAGRVWDDRVSDATTGAAVERCAAAFRRGPSEGEQAMRSETARVWRVVREEVAKQARNLLTRRFEGVVGALGTIDLRRPSDLPDLAVQAPVVQSDSSGDASMIGMVVGGLIGAATGGLGFVLFGAFSGFALGAELTPGQRVDPGQVRAELRRLATAHRRHLTDDVERAAAHVVQQVWRAARDKGAQQIAARRAEVEERHRVLLEARADAGTRFRLSGRSWKVERIDWSRGQVWVAPSERGRIPSWTGLPALLPAELTAEMMAILASESDLPWLDAPGAAQMAGLREAYSGLLDPGTAPLEGTSAGVQWHTFAGGAVNRLLAAGLKQVTGDRWTPGNLSLKTKDLDVAGALRSVRRLEEVDWDAAALVAAQAMARGRISKFQPCLPEDMEQALLVRKLLDVSGTLSFLARTTTNGVRVLDAGPRLREVSVEPDAALEPGPVPVVGAQPQRPVHWVATDARLEAVARELAGTPILGLDVETTLRSHTLCLVQLGTPAGNWVIDALAVSSLEPLRDLLEGPATTLVIQYAHFEKRILGKAGFTLTSIFDTWAASRARHGVKAIGGHSLVAVAERELGIVISKEQQTSNWARRPLSFEQVRYAALDAELMIDLHSVFHDDGKA